MIPAPDSSSPINAKPIRSIVTTPDSITIPCLPATPVTFPVR